MTQSEHVKNNVELRKNRMDKELISAVKKCVSENDETVLVQPKAIPIANGKSIKMQQPLILQQIKGDEDMS